MIIVTVNKSNMAAIAVYYTKFWCMVSPKVYDCNPSDCVSNAHIQKIKSQEHILIQRNIIYPGVSPSKPIFP